MSAFEVVVTPTRVKNARRKNAAREPTSVVLAPFSAKSVVTFDDIPVTKTARRFVNITNPSDDDLEVTLTNSIDSSFGVQFEWTTNMIPSNKSVTLEIVWTPKVEVKTKDTITIIDDRHFKKDVALIFKSIEFNANGNKTTKPPAFTKTSRNVTGKLKIKSPSPPQGLLRQAMLSNKQKVKSTVKESVGVPIQKAPPLHSTGQMPFHELNVLHQQNKFHSIHGKENKSPPNSGTLSASALFDDIQFTPVNRQRKKKDLADDVDDIDMLASLPTPVTKPTYNFTYALGRNPSDTMEITSFEPNIASTVDRVTNSFEPKQLPVDVDPRRKLFDMSSRSFCPDYGVLPTSTAPVFNVTHTIVPAMSLTDIKEEPDDLCPMQKTFQLPPKCSNEKSSVEFVTVERASQQSIDTLHKKFQSMRNLDDISVNQKMLRDNLGSMPNLTDNLEVQSIESNRYFYQNIETGLQTNDKRNQSVASSVFGGSVMSFAENDFLAQSSRFDLDKSHGLDAPIPGVIEREFAVPQPVDNYAMKRFVDDEHHKRKPTPKWSPPKRAKLDCTSNSSLNSSNQSLRRTSNWAGVKPKKFPYVVPKLNLTRQKAEEERVVFFDPEHHFRTVINPDVFAATTTNDPFLCATMYLDEECIEKHEINFKKWLNALVTIPWDVDSDKQQQIDFGKLFNDVRGKDLNMAETKEQVSSHYLTKHRMESLRKTATTLYMSENMTAMFQKLCVQIERGQLKMRDGIDLHLDIVLQREILQLLLHFNPLWLRISLEVIYGEVINMSHNFDILSLSRFIVNRLFKNKHLEQKYSKLSSQKSEQLKKFSLKKLFMLLIFLDNAKRNKIITHNPCLFVKTSPHKETKEILFKFSSLILGNMGDIQRDLKRIGIVLSHKQTYIEEFDYAFRNLAVDLRDGIRLTKVMEIILLRDDMVDQLRVPAISRLQKVYNVDLALKALRGADYVISGGILAADIADGHREKTLSLLWQIIYKFRAPKFIEAAIVIQLWWRRSWLKVVIKQRIRAKLLQTKTTAATRIQAAYRGHLSRKCTKKWYAKRTSAAIILQSHIRRYLAQKYFKRQSNAAKFIGAWYKRTCLYNQERNNYLHGRNSIVTIQKWYRRMRLAHKIESLVPMIRAMRDEVATQNRCATILQIRYRATCLMRLERRNYLKIRSSAIFIQQRFRSYLLMKQQRTEYLRIRETIVIIQRQFRANLQSKKMRNGFQLKKNAALCIQKYFRATVEARKVRNEFVALKKAAQTLQIRYRARLATLKAVKEYETMKRSAIVVQQHYRAKKAMEIDSTHFKYLQWSATVIQERYRAQIQMKHQRIEFLKQKSSAITIQRWVRSSKQLRTDRHDYLTYRQSVINIQQRYRAKLQMQEARANYKSLQWATIFVQRKFRAKCLMKQKQNQFQCLRNAAIVIQRRYRANVKSIEQVAEYRMFVKSVKLIQIRFRAYKSMKVDRERFLTMRTATITIQKFVRAYQHTKIVRKNFLVLKTSTIFLQRLYRANVSMETEKAYYVKLRRAVVSMQTIHRANVLMKVQRESYREKREAVLTIQKYYRATQEMKSDRCKYLALRNAVLFCQRQFRANLMMLQQRCSFLILKTKVTLIQRKYRATLHMRVERDAFEQLKKCTIFIQRRFRSNILAKKQRSEYLQLKRVTVFIQRKLRANKAMQIQHRLFVRQKISCMVLQSHFRAFLIGKKQRSEYLRIRTATLTIQRRFVAFKLMCEHRTQYRQMRNAAIVIQTRYRAFVVMKECRARYEQLRTAVIRVQIRYRSNMLMTSQRTEFNRTKRSAIVIQRWFRATMRMKNLSNQYKLIRCLVVCIQQRFRAKLAMKRERANFLQIRDATIVLQRQYRARQQMIVDRSAWNRTRSTVIGLQSRIRGYIARERYRKKLTPEYKLHVKQSKCATKIQAFWRGWMVRKKKGGDGVALKKIREKVQKISKNVKVDKTIKNVVRNYVTVLKKRCNADETLNVLLRLTKLSRLVPHLLVNDSIYVVNFCYGVMSQAIRSEMDKLIIEQCSYIILNLARYELTKANVFQLQGLTTIAQMLLRWCDKDCDIFNTLCSVVFVFCQSVELTKEIRNFMTSYDAELFTLHETKRLVKRKENMRKNKTQLSSTPSRQNARQSNQLPMLKPDFGMNSTKPYIFQSSVFAFDTILKKLNITNV